MYAQYKKNTMPVLFRTVERKQLLPSNVLMVLEGAIVVHAVAKRTTSQQDKRLHIFRMVVHTSGFFYARKTTAKREKKRVVLCERHRPRAASPKFSARSIGLHT